MYTLRMRAFDWLLKCWSQCRHQEVVHSVDPEGSNVEFLIVLLDIYIYANICGYII